MNDLLFEIHRGLPREGPGDRTSTLRALRSVMAAGPVGTVLDVGCGPGMQTVALAAATDAHIVALDVHRPYLDELRIRAAHDRVSNRIHAVHGSMFDMPVLAERVDVVWSEGAIYIIGFARGLREWRRVVRRSGWVVVSHLSWLADVVPDQPRRFWARHFPAMATVAENLRVAESCGYDPIEPFALPQSAWWDDYYGPLESRLAQLRITYTGDGPSLAAIEQTQEQIDLYRQFADCYGYVFYVLRVRDPFPPPLVRPPRMDEVS